MMRLFYAAIAGFCLAVLLCIHFRGLLFDKSDGVCDTVRLSVIDTIRYYRPQVRDSVVTRYVNRTLYRVRDSVLYISDSTSCRFRDSVTVEIPISQVVYEDSSYRAYLSGYEPRLDSLFLFPTKEYVSITRSAESRKKRWGLGIQLGCGYDGSISPYIGVGVSYNIVQW